MDNHDRDAAELADLERLREPTSLDDFARLRRRMNTHMEALEEQHYDFDHLDIELASQIADALTLLVEAAASLDHDQRSLLRGAVEYFLLTTDKDNDVTSPFGLRDDARVLNHVEHNLAASNDGPHPTPPGPFSTGATSAR